VIGLSKDKALIASFRIPTLGQLYSILHAASTEMDVGRIGLLSLMMMHADCIGWVKNWVARVDWPNRSKASLCH